MILAFKKEFVSPIVDGTKVHSIRAGSRWRAGLSIQFYANARRPDMWKFRVDDIAKTVQQVRLTADWQIIVDGRVLADAEKQAFANRDGFGSVGSLFSFFDSLPFTGQLIHWTDLTY